MTCGCPALVIDNFF